MSNNSNKPLYFFVANLGSEVQRFLNWDKKGDKEAAKNSYERTLLIVDKIKEFKNESANTEIGILIENLNNNVVDKNHIASFFGHFASRVINSMR